jgi:Putative regulator of cell autolysis
MEIKTLRSQMNPHFFFNSLNSIRNFIIKNEPQLASSYLANFATLMRKILDSPQQSTIPLEEEIEMLSLYIHLERMRISEKFSYQIEVDEELLNGSIDILSMIIQPFVENAIWHGLLNKEENNGHLLIKFSIKPDNDDEVLCEIIDKGTGREKSESMKSSIKKHKSKGI